MDSLLMIDRSTSEKATSSLLRSFCSKYKVRRVLHKKRSEEKQGCFFFFVLFSRMFALRLFWEIDDSLNNTYSLLRVIVALRSALRAQPREP